MRLAERIKAMRILNRILKTNKNTGLTRCWKLLGYVLFNRGVFLSPHRIDWVKIDIDNETYS